MKDRKTLWAFIVLICLMGFLIYLSIQKRNEDVTRDIRIHDLTTTVQSLGTRIAELQLMTPADGRTPVKGIDYVDGLDGKDGRSGSDGKDGNDGKDGVDGKDGKPAPELDIQCISNRLMKKYADDSFWQPTDIKCEVDNGQY